MATDPCRSVRRSTFLIDDILRAHDDDDRDTSCRRPSTSAIPEVTPSPDPRNAVDYQAKSRFNRTKDRRTCSTNDATSKTTTTTEHGSLCQDESVSIREEVSENRSMIMTSPFKKRLIPGVSSNDDRSEQSTPTSMTEDYSVLASCVTSTQETKPKLVDDQCRSADGATNVLISLSTSVARPSPSSVLNVGHHGDAFASAAAAGALFRLCNMHLSDRQLQPEQLKHQHHHQQQPLKHQHQQLHRRKLEEAQMNVTMGTAGKAQYPIDEWCQRQDHGQWAAALHRAMLQVNINSELSRAACFDRQRNPFYFRPDSSLTTPPPFPLLNFSRSSGDVITANVATNGGDGFSDREFLRMKCRRNRTVFTEYHLTSLEKNFDRQKYLSTKDRAQLAARLGLSQIQVKTWYQNRRMKWKKQVLQQGGTQPPTKPKGRPRKHEDDLNGKLDIIDGHDIH